jgi:hypothetical protein
MVETVIGKKNCSPGDIAYEKRCSGNYFSEVLKVHIPPKNTHYGLKVEEHACAKKPHQGVENKP